MKYYASSNEGFFQDSYEVESPADAAEAYACDHAVEVGDTVYVAWDSYPNPEYDPDYGASEDNPEFFLRHTRSYRVLDEDGRVEETT